MSDLEEPKPGVSRRTVAKAMAWSVPAIALAVPAPAYAASGGTISFTGAGCKLPGNSQSSFKGYVFKMSASNTTDDPITITILSAMLNGDNLGAVTVIDLATCTNLGNPFVVPADTTLSNLALLTTNASNSSNGTLSVTFTVSGVAGTDNASANVPDVPPIQGSSCSAFTGSEKTCIQNF